MDINMRINFRSHFTKETNRVTISYFIPKGNSFSLLPESLKNKLREDFKTLPLRSYQAKYRGMYL